MPSRRDILKATGGLVLATGGSWLASHAHAADAVPRPAELPEGMLASSILEEHARFPEVDSRMEGDGREHDRRR